MITFAAFDIFVILAWIEAWLPTIIPTVAAILPAIGALFGIIVSCAKLFRDNRKQIEPILKQFQELREEVRNKTDLREARAEMKQIIHDNAVLKRQLNELITLQSKVQHEVPEDDKTK